MCGIGGILRTDGKPIPEESLDAIDARIAWRGPDGHGRFRDRVEFVDERGEKRTVEVAFVHRRLSIIDHEGGHQPMVSERGRNEREGLVAVVFNGCIYNHRDLRKELEAKGHRFVTDHSDTEVLIHGWREWGEDLPSHLEGMYAFAVWDQARGKLALARDAFGEKPLYTLPAFEDYENAQPVIAFSSECASLFSITDARAEWDDPPWHGFACEFLRRGYLSPGSGLPDHSGRAVSDVLPATIDTFDLRGQRSEQPTIANEPVDTVSSMESALDKAVARRLEADVPLGCFLSGGVDSSLVSMFARRHKPDLSTFSVRMPDARYDETPHAETVAKHVGTKHTTLEVAVDPAGDLIHLISALGQPFGDSSILPTYWVSKAARQHVKVALSGDGGDELFIGYERYIGARLLSRHWRMLRHLPVSLLHRFHPKSRPNKLARLADMARDFSHFGIASAESIFTLSEIAELTEQHVYGLGQTPPDSPRDAIADLRQFDIENYLPGDLLRKVDTASMACGLEVRCPFLDRDLARAALSMPIEQLMPGGQRKGLLRQIARKYLPREIVDRPKMGFAIPIGEWFRSDYGGMKTLLLDHLNSTEPFGPISLSRKAVDRFIDEHMSGKRDHGQRLFALLTLSIWAKSQQVNKSTSQK